MRSLKLITGLISLLFAGSVYAQTAGRSVAENYATTTSDRGFIPSLGVAFGHMDQGGKSDVDGDGVTAQLIGSYLFENSNWIVDGGLGIHKQYFTDIDAEPLLGIISMAGRYNFAGGWSIGPAADLLFGSNEGLGTGNNYLTMIGAVGLKEITFMNDQLVRLGVKYSSEFGVSDQTNNYVGFLAQWGIGANNPWVRQSTAMNQ